MTLKKDIQNFNEAWNNLILAIGKALYLDKLVMWLSDKIKHKHNE